MGFHVITGLPREVVITDADIREGSLLTSDGSRGLSMVKPEALETNEIMRPKANFCDANLERAILSGSNLGCAAMAKANLRQANLQRADLHGVDLRRADLTNADLSGCNLTGAKLAHARLDGTNLTGADLSNVDLSEVDLTKASLTNARAMSLPQDDAPTIETVVRSSAG